MCRSTIFVRSFKAMRSVLWCRRVAGPRGRVLRSCRRAWSSLLGGAAPAPLELRAHAARRAVGAGFGIHELVPVLQRDAERVRVLRLPQPGDAGARGDAAHGVVHDAALVALLACVAEAAVPLPSRLR